MFLIIKKSSLLTKFWFQGNVLSWGDTRDKWQLSNVEMRQLKRSEQKEFGHSDKAPFEFCHSEDLDSKNFLVAFTERRPIEMSDYTCKVHGGRLPVPKNEFENKVRSKFCKSWLFGSALMEKCIMFLKLKNVINEWSIMCH
jgi:hypothetical protein